MNEAKVLVVKGELEAKKNILNHPNHYRNKTMICLMVDKIYLDALRIFNQEVNLESAELEVTIKEWPKDPTERAKEFFFSLRDRVCKASHDESREYKNHIYRECLKEMQFPLVGEAGYKTSIKQLDKRELWQATEKMYQWGFNAEAYMADFSIEFYAVKEGLGL